ncbi:MAG: hypothetical protein KDK91_24405 [Gammaproteobacteria bacterium]|nr:hypothetical protein [Gammaproteobacteria bacterium]
MIKSGTRSSGHDPLQPVSPVRGGRSIPSETPEVEHQIRRWLHELQHSIIKHNRAQIAEKVGSLSKANVVELAETVSRHRANYLREVLQLESTRASAENPEIALTALIKKREVYEEVLKGFEALRYAIERGYVMLEDIGES